MEKNSILLAKNKFTQIAIYRELTVQSEDRKKKHTVKNRFQSGKQWTKSRLEKHNINKSMKIRAWQW